MPKPDVAQLESGPYWLGFHWLVVEGEGPGGTDAPCLRTYLPMEGEPQPRLIAAQPMDEVTAQILCDVLIKDSRVIEYHGRVADPGIVAMLYARVKGADLIGTPFADPELDALATVSIYLGTVVRYKHDMKLLDEPLAQFTAHLQAILTTGAKHPVDKALEALSNGQPG